jgi:hypothetical protein
MATTYDTTTSNRALDAHAGESIEVLEAGITAGLVGGALMALFLMTYMAVVGYGFWMPLRLIGATIYGVDALVAGAGIAALGGIIHLVISTLFGVLFASLVQRHAGPAAAVVFGVAFGVVVLVLMTYLVLPTLDPVMRARVALVPGAWFLAHLLFGLGVATAPRFRRAFRAPPGMPASTVGAT